MTQIRRRRLLLGAGLLALVAACASPPPRPTFPDIRFTAQAPLRLDAATLEVREEYQPPFRAPNVDHQFPVPPMRAAENWAHDRLKPTGRAGRIVFTVRNASAIETELPTKTGISGAFTTEPAQRYDLNLQATVQLVDPQGLPIRAANVQAMRSQGVLEGITPNERERIWYDMTVALMADFDKQMEVEIRNNFGIYLNQ